VAIVSARTINVEMLPTDQVVVGAPAVTATVALPPSALKLVEAGDADTAN